MILALLLTVIPVPPPAIFNYEVNCRFATDDRREHQLSGTIEWLDRAQGRVINLVANSGTIPVEQGITYHSGFYDATLVVPGEGEAYIYEFELPSARRAPNAFLTVYRMVGHPPPSVLYADSNAVIARSACGVTSKAISWP